MALNVCLESDNPHESCLRRNSFGVVGSWSFKQAKTGLQAEINAHRTQRISLYVRVLLIQGVERTEGVFQATLAGCARVGRWRECIVTLDKMRKSGLQPRAAAYNSVITACGRGGQWQRAIAILQQMSSRGATPDVITLNAAMTACTQVWRLLSHGASGSWDSGTKQPFTRDAISASVQSNLCVLWNGRSQ